ncbi:hypothetical protein PMAYCL1PPCAC_14653, partial [Pristionchus mayeri]
VQLTRARYIRGDVQAFYTPEHHGERCDEFLMAMADSPHCLSIGSKIRLETIPMDSRSFFSISNIWTIVVKVVDGFLGKDQRVANEAFLHVIRERLICSISRIEGAKAGEEVCHNSPLFPVVERRKFREGSYAELQDCSEEDAIGSIVGIVCGGVEWLISVVYSHWMRRVDSRAQFTGQPRVTHYFVLLAQLVYQRCPMAWF